MIGKRSAQRSLYDVGNVFSYSPKAGSFYDQLALVASELFRDEDFAVFYADHQGRPSAPPSELALLMLMQFYAGLSDEESVERSACDLRFATVLRRPAGERLCAKSTFQQFRAHLILHNKLGLIFERSISQTRAAGMLPKELCVAIDTKPILGRGAVMDTLNLLASGVRQLGSALAEAEGIASGTFFAREGLADYLKPSIKGSQDLDWSNRDARNEFLSAIVADCTKLLKMAGSRLIDDNESSDAQSFSDRRLRDAARLLEQLLLQDVDVVKTAEGGDKAVIRDGVTHGRVPSTTDPEQRHGRKSASKRSSGGDCAGEWRH